MGIFDRTVDKGIERVGAEISARSEARRAPYEAVEAAFDQDAYGAGETVRGTLTFPQPIGCRSVKAFLRFAEICESYTEGSNADAQVPVHDGAIEAGQTIPFELSMPAEVRPAFASQHGRLEWVVLLDFDIPRGSDEIKLLPFAARPDRVPLPVRDPKTLEEGGDWDVSLALDRWVLYRGLEVEATVTVGSPAPGRDPVEISLVWTCYYDEHSTDAEGSSYREAKEDPHYLETLPVDTSRPSQTFRFKVPADAPFTYKGTAVTFGWRIEVKQKRGRLRKDFRRIHGLRVEP